jgi:gluconolactonase
MPSARLGSSKKLAPIAGRIAPIFMRRIAFISLGVAVVTCLPCSRMWAQLTVTPTANNMNAPVTVSAASGALGSIKRLDPEAMDELLAKEAVIEKLASGFNWSEGPLWMPEGYLLFSDVPQNIIFKWDPAGGVSVFLQPSGYTGEEPRGGQPGSNGLTRDKQGRLIACQHGDRRVGRWENGKFVAVADRFEGKRFNSPNDVVVKSNGDIYFTDPNFGLYDQTKEIPFQGVYRVSAKDGSVALLTSEIESPNGLAFSPDEKILYVASYDASKAIWMAYPVNADGTLGVGRVFLDVTDLPEGGLPDGLKVDERGNLWATGPGGVLIISAEGKHIGTLDTGGATATNCAWGDDGSTLFVTTAYYLCRVRTKVKGAGF